MLLLFAYRFAYCVYDQADDDRDHHIRQSVSNRCVYLHQNTIENEADQPDDQIHDIKRDLERVGLFQDEIISDLYSDHRRENRTDQVQEVGDIVHRIHNRCDRSDDGHDDCCPLLRNLLRDRYAGYTCGIRIEECGCNR